MLAERETSVTGTLRAFLSAAVAGQPVFITDVRAAFAMLDPESSFTLSCRLRELDGSLRSFDLVLPRFAALPAHEQAFVVEYFLGSAYNVISVLGGQELMLSTAYAGPEPAELLETFAREFGVNVPRAARTGYGRAINIAERMHEAMVPVGSAERFRCTLDRAQSRPDRGDRPQSAASASDIGTICRAASTNLSGKTILGIDVGGTDIKSCLAINGCVASLKSVSWFPAGFTSSGEIVDPILLLVRLMRLEAVRASSAPLADRLAGVLGPAICRDGLPAIRDQVLRGEAIAGHVALRMDAIAVGFPDDVVRDRIVGGEGYKTRGIRANAASDYDTEMQRLARLDLELRPFVSPGGVVAIVNDGPVAAFTAAVELAASNPAAVASGVFAHTLGTELGTGWITEAGVIPEKPLNIYNCVIDLGSYPERAYSADDARSTRNFNTGIAGTLQKYASQSGVFRLAMKHLPVADPDLFNEMLGRGYVVEMRCPNRCEVPTAPRDMRKPLLELLMTAVEDRSSPAADQIFRELGEFLAVAWLETEWLLDPKAKGRVLFGGVLTHPACSSLVLDGATRRVPRLSLVVADEELATTPLMKDLKGRSGYSVAQFGQAIGAVHYANYRLQERGQPQAAEPGA